MEKKLHRIPEQAVFGGVASGLAQYFQIDVVIIRVLFVVMLLLPIPPSFGWTGLIYIILWAVLPTGPAINYTTSTDPNSAAQPLFDKKTSDQTVMILGGVLVAFGAVMLLDDFPIWYELKRYFWPIAFIAIGAFLILRQRDKENESKSNTVYPTTPPPTDPVPPVTPEPEPQPYTPFNTPRTSSGRQFPEDPESPQADGDDPIIKVN
ncbi:PspC domain-containing protein [Dyadobacter crusticola]|uniref:PspC domain-containing protein n=1 Tax=Dyadobacter crusticola TaxID=292407 RepID=UPI0004E1572B|nr:PspC domain-containing protein [Dyadobacter crusticola]